MAGRGEVMRGVVVVRPVRLLLRMSHKRSFHVGKAVVVVATVGVVHPITASCRPTSSSSSRGRRGRVQASRRRNGRRRRISDVVGRQQIVARPREVEGRTRLPAAIIAQLLLMAVVVTTNGKRVHDRQGAVSWRHPRNKQPAGWIWDDSSYLFLPLDFTIVISQGSNRTITATIRKIHDRSERNGTEGSGRSFPVIELRHRQSHRTLDCGLTMKIPFRA